MASRGMFQITNVPVLLDVAVTFFRSVVVLTANDNFCTVSLLHSVSDIIGCPSSSTKNRTKCARYWISFYFLVEGSQSTYAPGFIHNSYSQ